MVAAQEVRGEPAGPQRPPTNIEDFLWNIHSVLVASPSPLVLDHLKDAYSVKFGHKCAVERFLVVGEGGLPATFKRIPHIVTLFQDNGTTCLRATQPANIDRQQLIDADLAYRRELIKKNAAAKAKQVAGAKPATAVAPAKSAAASAPDPAVPAKAAAPPQAVAGEGTASPGKRPAEAGAQAGAGDAKKVKFDSDADTLARMLVQGVVRVLQNRTKQGKGALPIGELEEEFKALWKVPFNLKQAGEQDAVQFLQKWPNKVELSHDGTQHLVQLPKKGQEKAKAGSPAKAVGDGAAVATAKTPPAGTVGSPAATSAPKQPGPKVGSPDGATTATAVKAAAKSSPPPMGAAAKATGTATPATAVKAAAPEPQAMAVDGASPKRPPASIEDFLWNIHSVIDANGGPMLLDQLRDAYSKHLGHKCAIERFLVVGDGGLAATLKRIPHVISVYQEKDGGAWMLKSTLASTTTKEQLIQVDHNYRRQLQQKNAAAKAATQANKSPSAAAQGGAAPSSTPSAAPAVPAVAGATAAATPGGAASTSPAAAPAAPSATGTNQSTESGTGERDAKRPRTEDADTLARMLVQGIVRILQNRAKEGKGPLPIANLEEEFKALWKVPFNLQQAGETDAVTFLQKWPNKVEVIHDGTQHLVQPAKKAAEKAKNAPAATKAAQPVADVVAKKAAPQVPSPKPAPPSAATVAQAGATAAVAAVPTELGLPSTSAPKEAMPQASPDQEDAGAADIQVSAAPAEIVDTPQTLPEIREQAATMLQSMQEMLRRQEALVGALSRLNTDAPL